ncbi:hypothetical protein Ocin01_16917 [Orchesella cincta]|uniref:Uncharacterized protein n=1 Tax=Orchesella cincta TaxID=48709 RepID=A0A1D2M9V4_ORCCI|nr:hypothetical protein Ocin01_16917 [Orchesella cincta]
MIDDYETPNLNTPSNEVQQYSQKKWDREILTAYGGVKLSEVREMRALAPSSPFLAIGGNNMFKMLHDSNFTYDSSMPAYENRPPSWPYTLDYRIFDCIIPLCPPNRIPESGKFPWSCGRT